MKIAHTPIFTHVEMLLGPLPIQTKHAIKYPFRDRYRHTVRVYQWCERLSRAEDTPPDESEALLISAIFHDSGYAVDVEGHARASSVFAREYMTAEGFGGDIIDSVCWLCEHHSIREPSFARTPLLALLQDADRLDETGAMTVLWDAMAEGGEASQSYEKTYERLESMYPRAEARINELHTREAKRIYALKIEFLRSFLDNLRFDLGLD